ncbi:hypothetical protein [Halalkalibacter nanhaiisediminis]|uniref:Uncharacterized protein n=1 Tax=Halalkalibacter nanhaiisediminis TaxID=688079 RepID=A0A562QN05_9BACI|nr:hypothetical protein [Halalkalibacter nanhaiisediminis]TWI58124.1 hypothetical protein IQ10_01456 [Halalkalibacter nanhaiisediminis]
MKELDKFPRSIKKVVRYIKQDATREQLEEIKKIIDFVILRRSLQ